MVELGFCIALLLGGACSVVDRDLAELHRASPVEGDLRMEFSTRSNAIRETNTSSFKGAKGPENETG